MGSLDSWPVVGKCTSGALRTEYGLLIYCDMGNTGLL